MHALRRPFVGGNWKMNTDLESAVELARAVVEGVKALPAACEIVICPPFPFLTAVAKVLEGSPVLLGGQDVSSEANGAFTGQVSAEMLLDCGCQLSIIGHSERRRGLAESDQLCAEKLHMALESGLTALLCVGETWEERESGQAHEVNRRQLGAALAAIPAEHLPRLLVAYEPVWAIGTGRTAAPRDAEEAHAFLRAALSDRYDSRLAERVRILYGGSVNAANASTLFDQPNVDGGLIGGASLKPGDFLSIVKAASRGGVPASNHP